MESTGPDFTFLKRLAEATEFVETTDELLAGLRVALNGYTFLTPIIPEKYVVCRARILDSNELPRELKELSYPPISKIKDDHRCGRAGESLFYCSNSNEIALHEVRAKANDIVLLSFWRSKAPLLVGALGYSSNALQRLGSQRTFLGFGKSEYREGYSGSVDEMVSGLLADCFTKRVEIEPSSVYRVSIAISEMILKQSVVLKSPLGGRILKAFDAVLYPSIEGRGNGDNLAIRPDSIEEVFEPLRVEAWDIRDRSNSSWAMSLISTAMNFFEAGKIAWDEKPVRRWQAETAGGLLTFDLQGGGFITTNAQGEKVKKPLTV